MRMFIGSPLSRAARRHIAGVMDGARAELGRGVVPAENLHITLNFLGEVGADRIEDIRSAMLRAVQGCAPVSISTGNTGRFGGGLLYLKIEDGATELARIKDKLDAELRSIGVSFDDKPFRPHITLARRVDKRLDIDIPPVSFAAGGITLFKSERERAGQVYTPVAEAAFSEGRLFIDRLEGEYAVCQNSGGGKVDIALGDLPFQAAEGMVLYKDGAVYSILEQSSITRFDGRRSDRQARE